MTDSGPPALVIDDHGNVREHGGDPRPVDAVFAFAIDGKIGPFRTPSSYVLTPVGNATKLINHVDLESSSRVLGLAAPLAVPRVKAGVGRNLNKLKQILEAGG
jgi:hypothetical protein